MLPLAQHTDACSAPRPLIAARRVIAHVDLDAFFASVEQLLNPRLRGKPVVVGGAPDQRGVVASASYEARARGLHVPMPLVHAYRVCPEAHFLPGRHHTYGDFSRRVFEVCREFSPEVEQTGIDEGYLDWTGDQWLGLRVGRDVPVHWPLDLANRLRDAVFERTGLCVSIGIGANRMIAKIAGKYCKPKGVCHVAPGSEWAFLRPMQLKVVPGIGPRTSEILAAAGLFTFRDAQDMAEDELVARLGGQWAAQLRRIANGQGRATLETRGLPKSVSNERTFDTDCWDLEVVRRTLYRLVEKAAWRLRRAGLKAGTVSVKLRHADFQTYTRARSLGFASDCHRELYMAASELLSSFPRRGQAIRLVGAHLSALNTASHRQLHLYDEDERDSSRQVDALLDLVRDRFEFKAIRTAAAL